MAALRGTTGITRGTRVPVGASAPRPSGQATYREAALWPGIAWGRSALCSCSWAVRGGVAEVKVQSAACTVHVPGRKPGAATAGPLPPAPTDEELLAACRAGTVTWELYLAAVRSWQREHRASLLAASLRPVIGDVAEAVEDSRREPAACGTRQGYDQHLRDGSRTCPACRAAKTRKPGAAGRREAA